MPSGSGFPIPTLPQDLFSSRLDHVIIARYFKVLPRYWRERERDIGYWPRLGRPLGRGQCKPVAAVNLTYKLCVPVNTGVQPMLSLLLSTWLFALKARSSAFICLIRDVTEALVCTGMP